MPHTRVNSLSEEARRQYSRYDLRVNESLRSEYLLSGLWSGRTVLGRFRESCRVHASKPALVSYRQGRDEPSVLMYSELARAVSQLAGRLREEGVDVGDVVTAQLPNGPEFVITAFATLSIGGIFNPIIPILRLESLTQIVSLLQTRVFITVDNFRGFQHAACANQLAERNACIRAVIVAGDQKSNGALNFDSIAYAAGQSARNNSVSAWEPDADCISDIQFTSGTTGAPKGVAHVHHSLVSRTEAFVRAMELTDRDVVFMPSPLGHSTGFLYGAITPAITGMTAVLVDTWDPERALDLIEEYRPTWSFGSPTFAIDLVRAQRAHPRRTARLPHFVAGGAPIPAALVDEVEAVLSGRLHAVWGMTENGAATCVTRDEDAAASRVSDGKPVRGMSVRVKNPVSGEVLDAGIEGELYSRGPSQMLGYVHDRRATSDVVDAEGWFRTGDRARIEPDGAVRIVGRSKDVIIRGGENIPVGLVEQALYEFRHVQEAAVVPYPDDRLGERACAVVVTAGGCDVSLADIQEYLRGRDVPKQFWPERLVCVARLPRTPSGKVQKHILLPIAASSTVPPD